MFLSDQQKANKAQNTDIKLLDLVSNAIKEWDQVQDESPAKFLQESERSDAPVLPDVQQKPIVASKPQPTLHFDEKGNVRLENDEVK